MRRRSGRTKLLFSVMCVTLGIISLVTQVRNFSNYFILLLYVYCIVLNYNIVLMLIFYFYVFTGITRSAYRKAVSKGNDILWTCPSCRHPASPSPPPPLRKRSRIAQLPTLTQLPPPLFEDIAASPPPCFLIFSLHLLCLLIYL